MALIYGEEKRAFLTLQRKIIKTKGDDSILAWSRAMQPAKKRPEACGLLAKSLESFGHMGPIINLGLPHAPPDINIDRISSSVRFRPTIKGQAALIDFGCYSFTTEEEGGMC